ncbi:Uncharacterised protein [Burkholderia pseudomallei]|nr:Uncharacterised protein [Burkholderia pseudomallei]CAJ8421971.1 Uncharacterised protein [Burkholderia pseudomallei]
MGSDVGAGRCRCSDLRACAGAMMRCETARCEMRDARCETARRRDGEMAGREWRAVAFSAFPGPRFVRLPGRYLAVMPASRRDCVPVQTCVPQTRRPADPQTRKSQIANRKSQIANRKSQIANRKNRVRNAFSHFARPPFICNPKPVTRRVALPSTADCRLPTADCRLPTADCPLPTADREPSIADRRPRTADRPSSPNAPARPHRDARNL